MSWATAKLSDVATIERNGVDPKNIVSDTFYLGLENIESGGRIIGAQTVSKGDLASTKFRFSPDHILYGKLRPYLAKIALPDFNGICSTDILPVRPGPGVEKHYLAHFLRQPSMVDFAASRSSGANLPRLSPKTLADFVIPIPPLAEQERIAAILDKADALHRLRQCAIDQLTVLGQAIFQEMFGSPIANERGWKIEKLKDLSTRICSGSTPAGGKKVYVDEGVAFLRSQNVWRRKIELDDIVYIDEATHKRMSKTSLQKGDILITKTGRINTENSSLGRAALFTGEDGSANINGHVYLIRTKDEVLEEFVEYILAMPEYRDYIRRVCVGGIDKRQINKIHIDEFPIIYPPIKEQKTFLQRLSEVEAQKGRAIAQSKRYVDLFLSLQQRAFKGEL
jgi:type I restriction enzyme S subunit